ncbi:MAG TPA: amidohydrolase [Candidatus Acidoferrales bacterium]|nr:amidohydrolase [Candidatus Acidoferrales bacterium]
MDLFVRGGTVITMDAEFRVIDDGGVAIEGDTIAAVGKRADLEAKASGARKIEAGGTLVMPGMINGHAHAAMSLFRGVAEDHSLNDWLQKYIFPAEARNVTEDFILWGTRLGVLEMLRGGITTYADMYYFEDVVASVTKEAGMRGVLGETIVDFPAPDHKTPAAALAYTEKFIQRWRGDPLITPGVAPHSMYTLSTANLKAATALARRTGAPILIHVAEAPFESDLSQSKHGMSPVAYLDSIGLLGPDVIAAHTVWLDQEDIATLVRRGVGSIHNPSSNMKLASGVMPVVDLLAAGQAVGLATDSAASNNNQDLFQEMNIAAKLQKVTRMDPRVLPARQVVEMATIGGARALHLDARIGSLEVSKQADIVLIGTGATHATPMYNVYSQLVYALNAHDVRSVVIAGKIVMEDRVMFTMDKPAILAKAHEYQRKISASLIEARAI